MCFILRKQRDVTAYIALFGSTGIHSEQSCAEKE